MIVNELNRERDDVTSVARHSPPLADYTIYIAKSVTIAKSESREVGFFSDFRHPKFFSGTLCRKFVDSGSRVHDPGRNLERESRYYGVQRLFCFF